MAPTARLRSGILGGTIPHVERNVRALMHVVKHDVIPFARYSAKNLKDLVSWAWPQVFSFPPALLLPMERSHFADLALTIIRPMFRYAHLPNNKGILYHTRSC